MGKDFRSETAEAVSRFQGSVRKAFTGYYRIKDFIRRVRVAKTAHDERTLVAKESAAIRSALKDKSISPEHRYHSLGKLIYIHLMGYPALFGQVECMKLAATVGGQTAAELRVKDKRLGYLGVSLLSDEHQETLTLVTNSFKYDLNSANEGVVSLALSALAQCVSPAMARELAPEIDRLLHQPVSPILRKKAAACALKMIQKDPELAGEGFFVDKVTGLLGDKNVSVVLGGVNLMTGLLAAEPALLSDYQRLLPVLCKVSKSITASPFDPEHDVSGIPDPVLQIALLRLMRRLAAVTDEYIDLLAILATTLSDSAKNVGHAVAFEVAQNILAIAREAPQLQSLATEILNKFLASASDSNLRFVALSLLKRQSSIDVNQTVLSCLHDADVSIRRAAMQVSLSAATCKNISHLTFELLDLCAREREDPQLVSECLRDLKGAIGRCARGDEALKLFIVLLKGHVTTEAPNEVVSFVVSKLRREIAKGRLTGAAVAKELFFALTITPTPAIIDTEFDSEVASIASSSTASTLSAQPVRPALSLPLLQVAIWSFGCWGWQGVVQESLCTGAQLIDLLAGFLTGAARSFALVALAKVAALVPEEKGRILRVLSGRQTDLREARVFIEAGVVLDEVFGAASSEGSDESDQDEAFDASFLQSSLQSLHHERQSIEEALQSTSLATTTATTAATTEHEPETFTTKAVPIGHLRVIVTEFLPQTGSLSLTITNPTAQSINSISVALAVSGGFDFDYSKQASRSVLSGGEELEVAVVLRKRSDDLLLFAEAEAEESVDYSACKVKMRVQYERDGETETHIAPVEFIS